MDEEPVEMNSPSAGGAVERSRNTSPSLTASNVHAVKQQTKDSNLLDKVNSLLNNPKQLSNQLCFVGQILASLSEEESKALREALYDSRIRHVDLLRICEDEGYKMSEATMRRHRAKHCRCEL